MNKYFQRIKTFPVLFAGFVAAGCSTVSTVQLNYPLHWQEQAVRAELTYSDGDGICAAGVVIHNESKKDYRSLMIRASFYSPNNDLVGSSTIMLPNGLTSGASARLTRSYTTVMNSPEMLQYRSCPSDAQKSSANITTF